MVSNKKVNNRTIDERTFYIAFAIGFIVAFMVCITFQLMYIYEMNKGMAELLLHITDTTIDCSNIMHRNYDAFCKDLTGKWDAVYRNGKCFYGKE